MNKLGFLVDNLGAGQLGYFLTSEINLYHSQNNDYDIIVYYQTLHKNVMNRNFAVMQMLESYSETCPLIATSLSTAFKLNSIKTCNQKYYYVYELEWLKPYNNQYEMYYHIFSNPSFKFLSRSVEEKKLINNCFNVDCQVINDFNMKEIINAIR